MGERISSGGRVKPGLDRLREARDGLGKKRDFHRMPRNDTAHAETRTEFQSLDRRVGPSPYLPWGSWMQGSPKEVGGGGEGTHVSTFIQSR